MAGQQNLAEAHPLAGQSDSPDFWETYLAENPDVLHRLLADVYQATFGVDKPPTLDALWDLMTGAKRFSSEPFSTAAYELLGKRSARWLALQAGVTHPTVMRYLNGERSPVNISDIPGSMARIESFAKPLKVHPAYFSEWRRLWIMQLLDAAFSQNPNLSVGVWKRFSSFENARSGGH